MTKICVTSTGPTLDSQMDPRFGRCQYFIIVDPDTMQFDTIPNDAATASGGAGIRAAQTILSYGVNVLITGSVGPNAYSALQNASIRIMSTTSCSVKEAVEQYKQGALTEVTVAGPAHLGMRGGRGGGFGRGGGRSRGRGRGGVW